MPCFYPLTRGNVNPPLALAKPVARDPSRLRHCHPAGNALVDVYGYFTTDSTNLQGDPNANQPNGYLQSEWVLIRCGRRQAVGFGKAAQPN